MIKLSIIREEVNGLKKRYIWIFACVLFTWFIFARSLKDAGGSSAESSLFASIYSYIYKLIFSEIPKNPVATVRKLAHIAEYAIQGMLLCGVFSTFKEKVKGNVSYILFFGLFTACMDEFIQLYTYGRAGLVADIFIDFTGTLAGIIIFLFFSNLIKRK